MRTIRKNGLNIIALASVVLGFCLSIQFPYAKTLLVGKGKTFSSPCKAINAVFEGDTVLIDVGTYTEACIWSTDKITLRGVAKFAHMKGPENISNGKAIWVTAGNNITIENIEFSGAKVDDENGAGIRADGKNLNIRHCFFHDNQNGILGGEGAIKISNTEFSGNGKGDGYTHNLYISHGDSLIMDYCYSHGAKIGHEVKSRAKVNILRYNRFMNESAGTGSYTVDLPNGGNSVLIGNLLQQGPNSDNSSMVIYGAEGLSNPGKTIYLINNTLVNDRSGGTFVSIAGGATAFATNNLLIGSGTSFGGTVTQKNNLKGQSNWLKDMSHYDYHLVAGVEAINAGSDPGTGNGLSLVPIYQYVHPLAKEARPKSGVLDVGAYEYSVGGSGVGDQGRDYQRDTFEKELLKGLYAKSPVGTSGIFMASQALHSPFILIQSLAYPALRSYETRGRLLNIVLD